MSLRKNYCKNTCFTYNEFMDGKYLKKCLRKAVNRVGPAKVSSALILANVGASTTEKLVADNYQSVPRGETAFRIRRALIELGEIKEEAS